MQGWVVVIIALAYLTLLFAIASIGDRRDSTANAARSRPYTYAFSLAIYCTSWTFFGSVGLAAERGPEFLTIYLGPMLIFIFGYPLLRRIVRLAQSEKITSIADFLGARYGKSFAVASIATLIATVGVVPYIALQLKAISGSVSWAGSGSSSSTDRAPVVISLMKSAPRRNCSRPWASIRATPGGTSSRSSTPETRASAAWR